MSTPILQTKLIQPPLRPGVVQRVRLSDRLDRAWHGGQRLALIAAPAGYGKTTLALSWLEQLPPAQAAVAWLSVDERDDAPDRLLLYLVAAIQMAWPDFELGLFSGLPGWQGYEPDRQFPLFLNAIAARTQPLILALDDAHHLRDPAVLALMSELVDQAPGNMFVLMTCRDIPALPLPRWQARAAMTSITADDLRFADREVASFLQQTMGLTLAVEFIQQLSRQTEGWAAGLQLVALSVQQGADVPTLADDFGRRERLIVDYLTSEVLAAQTEKVRRFLLTTSIMERFCVSLCERLLPDIDAGAVLTYLERSNLFLVPLDRQRQWYRYHHLFADLLQSQLRQDRSQQAIIALHQVAAGWFEEHGLTDEAIYHAVAAGDLHRAARLIEALPMQILWDPRGALLVGGWLAKIPPDVSDTHPRLLLLGAGAFILQGEMRRAGTLLARLAAHSELAAEFDLLKAILVRNQGDHEAARTLLTGALPELAQREPMLHLLARLQLAVISADLGELAEARVLAASVRREVVVGAGALHPVLLQAAHLETFICLVQGDLREAEMLTLEAQQSLLNSAANSMPMIGLLDGVLGSIYYQWNEFEKAEERFQAAYQAYERSAFTDLLIPASLGLAEIALVRNQPEQVQRWLSEIKDLARRLDVPFMQATIAAEVAGYQVRMGDIAAALNWAAAAQLDLDDRPEYLQAARYLTLARVRLAEDLIHGANRVDERLLALLQYLDGLYARAGHSLFQIECQLMIGLLHQLGEEMEEAMGALKLALQLARSWFGAALFS